MKKYVLFILLATALFPSISFGCSCEPPTSFCESITNSNGDLVPNLIIRGKIENLSPIEIKVNQLILGKTNQNTIAFNPLILKKASLYSQIQRKEK